MSNTQKGAAPVRRLTGICIGLAIFAGASAALARGSADAANPGVIHQLRIYEIFDANKDAFHARFRDHAARIMARHDFRIVSMWESRHDGKTEFVYLLEWPDRETMKDRWTKFMADKEWSDIKVRTRDRGGLVGDIQDRTLDAVDYSPRKRFFE